MSIERYQRCPDCGKSVRRRADGVLGTHFALDGKFSGRIRCSGGGQLPAGRPRARRVTVAVEVLLPPGWSNAEFRARAAAAIRRELDEAVVVDLTVEDEAS